MSSYSDAVESYSNAVEDNVLSLNNYADAANSATTRAIYDSNLSLYNKEEALYNKNIAQYDESISDLQRYATYRKVSTRVFDLPDKKDRYQWLAGGTLRNETLAGGYLWSPVDVPSFENNATVGKTANLLNGNMLEYLGYGFGKTLGILGGGILDLMFDDDVRETIILSINIEFKNERTGQVLVTKSFDFNSDSNGDSDRTFDSDLFNNANAKDMSLDEIAATWNSRSNLRSLLQANPLLLTLEIINLATQSKATIETRLAGALLGTVTATIKQAISQAVVKSLGITAMTPAVFVGLQIFNMVFNELIEMVLGLDNHFGFGGDYIGTKGGMAQFEEAYSAEQVTESIKGMFGFESVLDVEYTTKAGAYTGYGKTEYTGFGEFGDEFGFGGTVISEYDDYGKFEHTVDTGWFGDVYSTYDQGDYTRTSWSGAFEESSNTVEGNTINTSINSIGGYSVTGTDALGNDVNISTDAEGNITSSEDADSGGGDGSVICTVLKDKGDMTDEVYASDDLYGQLVDKEVYEGYLIWGKPLAKEMRNHRVLYLLMKPLVVSWSKNMHYEITKQGSPTVIGRLSQWIGEPICRLIYKIKCTNNRKL